MNFLNSKVWRLDVGESVHHMMFTIFVNEAVGAAPKVCRGLLNAVELLIFCWNENNFLQRNFNCRDAAFHVL